MAKELLQYNIEFDKRENDLPYNRIQLETHLRERFNALLSIVEYGIVDGHLVRQGASEPFVNAIARGRNHIRTVAPNQIDFAREDAEVEGFRNVIDPLLSNPNTSLGTKVISISPKGEEGSRYKHNFYDIFTLNRKNGQRFVELRRYSSALIPEEYTQKDFFVGLYPQNPTAADFLSNPTPIANIFISAEQIHQTLHKEHDYMKEEEFIAIWNSKPVQDRVNKYLFRKDAKNFNAILNCSDDIYEENKKKKRGEQYLDFERFAPSAMVVQNWENREVRQAAGGCPGKSGAEDSSYSASEFADMDYKFDQPGPCKKCGEDVSCGPCGICKPCDIKIRREESTKIAA